MSVLIFLLPLSLVLGGLFLALFIRAVRSGQYEDTITPAMRVLADDEPGVTSKDWKKMVTKDSNDWKPADSDLKVNREKRGMR